MAGTEPLPSNSGSAVQKITSLVQKFTKSSLPQFIEYVKKFHTTLSGIVVDLITSFETPNYEARKLSSEATGICQELKKMMSSCNVYMARVNKLAWFAKREERKQGILKALQQNDHSLAPLKEYIEQLMRPFIQVEGSGEELERSFDGIQQRLQTLLEKCEEKLDKAEKKKFLVDAACGIGAAGGVFLAGGGAVLAAAAPTLGLGNVISMLISGAGMAKIIDATRAFTSNLRALRTISQSIHSSMTDVQQELRIIKGEIEEIETLASPHESLVNLTESLQYFFEELTTSGNRISKCYEDLKQKELLLENAIVKVLRSELTAS